MYIPHIYTIGFFWIFLGKVRIIILPFQSGGKSQNSQNVKLNDISRSPNYGLMNPVVGGMKISSSLRIYDRTGWRFNLTGRKEMQWKGRFNFWGKGMLCVLAIQLHNSKDNDMHDWVPRRCIKIDEQFDDLSWIVNDEQN